jgi:hypothetical protein
MDDDLRDLVWRRAGGVCEYCRMPQALLRLRFEIDHVIARQHGGSTDADNLALICPHCNLHKGPNLAGIDPVTGQIIRLFHPRHDSWADHFAWQGHELVGRTPIGRATVAVLALNDPVYRAVRAALMAEGSFPPG